MAASLNRPIFVIGSSRSGTSILTWCLGQHSNILVQEESNWLGRFSLDVEAAYFTGTHRGERSQLSALGIPRELFFNRFGQAINEIVLEHRHELIKVAKERSLTTPDKSQEVAEFRFERSESDPKRRWVDGTPEYSFYVCGLRKLFPEAVFIHVVRDAAAVVRSILHFSRISGRMLADNEERAYQYWLRIVRACAQAEHAYGSNVVRRILHADLVAQPETTIRSLLESLGEPYEAACLEPLRRRINSSNVPADFEASDPATDQSVIQAALTLENELTNDRVPIAPSSEVAAELEAKFETQVRELQSAGDYNARARSRIESLENEVKRLREQLTANGGFWRRWLAPRNTRV
jgi:hypothetical protein